MTNRRVLLVAAENDALPRGKVGGIGDVIRDVPPALARRAWTVDVVVPSHGFLHRHPGARQVGSVTLPGSSAAVYVVPGKTSDPGVTHYVIDVPRDESDGAPSIFVNDPPARPFATDATKFARFCRGVAEALLDGTIPRPDCLHLHDWHAAFLLILRRQVPRYSPLLEIRTAYTIHNLALQGVRPLEGDPSSLAAWYPEVKVTQELEDPRWRDCVNPMAVGIRLADAVHTVSPTYAREILLPSEAPRAYGGEGLETDLQNAEREGRLFGILNGCDYPLQHHERLPGPSLLETLRTQVLAWIASQRVVSSTHSIALERLRDLKTRPLQTVLTSVTRVTDQKMYLMRAKGSDEVAGVDGLLRRLGSQGVYILLGSGDASYEEFLLTTAARYDNFVFLNGYSDACANALYDSGDLFIMPSSFEPCGISQLLSMRSGQPCLVHGVGGLKDTVGDGKEGFVFNGDTVRQQVDAFVEASARALTIRGENPLRWQSIRDAAAATRFTWDSAVNSYIERLYSA
jgi:starch synthase